VYERQYLKDVRVGSPGKRLTLRMRWDLDDTYLYDTPSSYSKTFTMSGSAGSDLFFLRPDIEPIRLPVIYAQEPTDTLNKSSPFYNGARVDTSGGVSYQGSLGLGPKSPLWTVWTSYTVSASTLTLGSDDTLDALRHGDEIHSLDQFFVSTIDSNGIYASLPIEFKLSEEFTYLPLVVFSNITDALEKTPRIPIKAEGVGSSSIQLWLSTTSSFVVTSLGGPEDALRLSEQEGRNKSEIIIGRIQLLSNFLVYKDLVRNTTKIAQIYDTYPVSSTGQFPQAVLGLFAALLWCVWALITTPSTYQWLSYGMLPHYKGALAHLKKMPKKEANATSKGDALITELMSEDQPPSAARRTNSQRQAYDTATRSGPVDWMILRSLLFLSRLVCFCTFVVAVWGFRSGRFSARLSDLGGTGKATGVVLFWLVAVFQFITPVTVNVLFIRRYTHAGVLLVWTSLGLALWINLLPTTNTFSFIVFVRNLLIGVVVSIVALWWPMWCLIRGPDSVISERVTDAKEFLDEKAYIQPDVYEVSEMADQPSMPYHGQAKSPSSWESGEIALMTVWCLFILPTILAWLVLLNFLPFLESKLPHALALQVVCSLTLVALVGFLAFVIAGYICTQIHQEASIEFREHTLALLEKNGEKTKDD
jgi:hypothetical protein